MPSGHPYPARLTRFQARLGLGQLALLEENLQARRRAAAVYAESLGHSALQTFQSQDTLGHSWLRYTWLVPDRARWLRWFRDLVDPGVWFTSIAHGRDRDLEMIGYAPGSCPNAEFVVRHCINLPTHPRVTDPESLAERLRSGRAHLGILEPPPPARS